MTNTTATPTTHDIRAWRLPTVEDRFAKLAKLADKLGCEAPTFSVVGSREIEWVDEFGYKRHDTVLTVEVHGSAPVVAGGWSVVAAIEHLEAGNLIRAIPSDDTPDLSRFRTTGRACDHCGHKRHRNSTFVVRSAEGELVQAGSTCIKDFTGHDPKLALRFVTMLGGAFDEDGMPLRRDRDSLGLVEFVVWTMACSREYGYVTRGRSYQTGQPSTADTAWGEALAKKPEVTPTDADWTEARRVVDYARAVLADCSNPSDYEHSLGVALGVDYVTRKTMGFVASVVGFVQRHEARVAERKAQAEAGALSRHVGTAGERLDAVVTVEAAMLRDSMFGAQTLVKLVTETGDRLTWWASGVATEPQTEDGSHPRLTAGAGPFHATFTVKKHGEFRGAQETTVTRVTLSRDIDGFRKATQHACPHCQAAAGQWCLTPKGGRASKLHGKRTKLAK